MPSIEENLFQLASKNAVFYKEKHLAILKHCEDLWIRVLLDESQYYPLFFIPCFIHSIEIFFLNQRYSELFSVVCGAE